MTSIPTPGHSRHDIALMYLQMAHDRVTDALAARERAQEASRTANGLYLRASIQETKVLQLCWQYGVTAKEAAEILGWGVETVAHLWRLCDDDESLEKL